MPPETTQTGEKRFSDVTWDNVPPNTRKRNSAPVNRFTKLARLEQQHHREKTLMRQKDIGYDIGDRQIREVLAQIRGGGEDARHRLISACMKSYEPLADDLMLSILYGMSYEQIREHVRDVPIDKNSFYGYRRKAISLYVRML